MLSNAFARSLNAEAASDTGRVEEPLWLVRLPGQVVNFGEAQIPALVEFGVLGFLPEFIHLTVNQNLHIDAHVWLAEYRDVCGETSSESETCVLIVGGGTG
jgi:hypothetical protein